jgi:hypothetical protein
LAFHTLVRRESAFRVMLQACFASKDLFIPKADLRPRPPSCLDLDMVFHDLQ